MKFSDIRYLTYLLFSLILVNCGSNESSNTQMVDKRQTKYSLIIPENPSIAEREAAETLRDNLQSITRTRFSIITDATPNLKQEIVIGDSKRVDASSIAKEEVQPDGYSIKTEGQKLYVFSPREGEGIRYAIRDLLTSLGVEKFIPNMTVYSIDTTMTLPVIDVTFNPPFTWRSLDNLGSENEAFYTWHKLNNTDLDQTKWGVGSHDFNEWINPNDNPSFYTKIKDQSIPNAKFCLTNDEFFEAVNAKLNARINARKSAEYWEVSPGTISQSCSCEKCSAVNTEEDSPAGALIQFINKLAKNHSNKTIATMLSGDQTKPGKTAPANNVLITLSTEALNKSVPLITDKFGEAFKTNLDTWLTQTKNVMIYDHIVQYGNPVSPFPVFASFAENLKYYADKGIKMIHVQGSHEKGNDLAALKSYVVSRLLWDPNIEPDFLISQFTNEYYGDAGQFIKRYIDLMSEQAAKYGSLMTVADGPTVPIKTHLRPELMDQYNYFFNQAEDVIKADPEIRDRVKLARLPIVFTSLEQAKVYGNEKRGLFLNINGRWMAVPGMKTLATDFAGECKRLGVKYLGNGSLTPDEFANSIMAFTEQNVNSHKAIKQPVVMRRAPNQRFSGGNLSLLTDGLIGGLDPKYGWIGYEQYDMESTLTLAAPKNVSSLNIRFLHDPSKNIFLPKSVKVQISSDGTNYESIGSKSASSKATSNKPTIEAFTFNVGKKSVKSVKIDGLNPKTVPTGFMGSGQPSWIFADEIELN